MDFYISSLVEAGIQHLSEYVFVGLCRKVGTPTKVIIRREAGDIEDIFRNQIPSCRIYGFEVMYTGSGREGFRFESSDTDLMFWPSNFKVIWDLDQAQEYDNNTICYLCDCSESPPGFTLIDITISSDDRKPPPLDPPFVQINGKHYLSSSKYRQMLCLQTPIFREHGPCLSFYKAYREYDYAPSLYSKFWPPIAFPWIKRCHSWPKPEIVRDIVRNGCHVVPIGHKLEYHEEDEWRISFSQAEQKLVYSMNHCQFLTYGLLKIVVKEIINNECESKDELLCSYHMKTTLFWVIQQYHIPHWCPKDLLVCFWTCFKLLLKWVYEGVCPNFFIPENNMFLGKIHGEEQIILFGRLYKFYEMGLACLLYSPSIRPYIINALYNPRQSVCTDEFNLITEAELDGELFKEAYAFDIRFRSRLHYYINNLHTVEQLIGSPLTKYQVVFLQVYTAYFLQTTAFLLFNRGTQSEGNKLMYKAERIGVHILRFVAKFGCVSDMLYLVIYYYRTCRYMKALSMIKITKMKLSQPHVIHTNYVKSEFYSRFVSGQSLSKKLRQAHSAEFKFHPDIFYMIELIPEQSRLQKNVVLHIPPLILLYMLEILSSIHTDTIESRKCLRDLEVLVHFDEGEYISEDVRDISWQILGICQKITGNLSSAFFSYQQSLRQKPLHELQTVTLMRMLDIIYSLYAINYNK